MILESLYEMRCMKRNEEVSDRLSGFKVKSGASVEHSFKRHRVMRDCLLKTKVNRHEEIALHRQYQGLYHITRPMPKLSISLVDHINCLITPSTTLPSTFLSFFAFFKAHLNVDPLSHIHVHPFERCRCRHQAQDDCRRSPSALVLVGGNIRTRHRKRERVLVELRETSSRD